MNEADVRKTWDVLRQDRAIAYTTHPYLLHWFASRPDGTARAGDYVLNADELVKAAVAAEKMEMNFYVQLNPSLRRDGVRNRAEDVTHWVYHLLDLDPDADASIPDDPMQALRETLLFYHAQLGLKLHPHIIFSGRGVQAWIPFHFPRATASNWRVNKGDKLVWEGPLGKIVNRAQGYWLRYAQDRVGHAWKSTLDPAVADLPRVMRCPGTVNVKSGRTAEWVEVGARSSHLAEHLLRFTPVESLVPPDPAVVVPGRSWQYYVPLLNWSANRYVTVGGDIGTRHDMAVKAAKNLYELGCEEEQARAALAWGNKLSAPSPLDQPEMEQIIRSVYKQPRVVV